MKVKTETKRYRSLYLMPFLNLYFLQHLSDIGNVWISIIYIADELLVFINISNQMTWRLIGHTDLPRRRQNHVSSKITLKDKNTTVVLTHTWCKLSNSVCDYFRFSILWKVNPLMRNVPKWSGLLKCVWPFWDITYWKIKTQSTCMKIISWKRSE